MEEVEHMTSKYRNRKTIVAGLTFDSQREAARYQELKLYERGGFIRDLKCQVKFNLIPKQPGERAVDYVADFTYWEKRFDKEVYVVEDVKSPVTKTPAYVIKRKLMLWVHGIKIREV